MFTICICEGAPKQTPDLRIPPRRDRAPGLEIPGSATECECEQFIEADANYR